MTDWFRLPHLAGIRVSGPDAIAFAHSQFTSAFQQRTSDHWELSSRCNPKGRVLEVILGRVHEDHIEIVVPSEQASALAKALRLYAIGRRLQFQEQLAVAGSMPAGAGGAVLALDPTRALCLEPSVARVDERAVLDWRQADLRAGIAWLSPASSAEFLPQALGLEERGGLSYRKGCYPGQEIIARVHFLGKAKERLSAFRQAHTASAELDIVDDEGRRVGSVVCALELPAARIGLAVIPAELDPAASLHCGGELLTLLEPAAL